MRFPVENQQEKVIGRHKFNDVELSDEEKPENAHNAVTNIGDDLKIVRANMPFANDLKGSMVRILLGMLVHSARLAGCWRICLSAVRRAIPTACSISVRQ